MNSKPSAIRRLFRTTLIVLSVGAICVSGFAIVHRAAAQRAAVGWQLSAVDLAHPGLDQTDKGRIGSETLSSQGGAASPPARAAFPDNPRLAPQGNDAAQPSQTGTMSKTMPFGLPPNPGTTTYNPTNPTDGWKEEEINVLRPVTQTKMVRQPDGTIQPVTTVEYQNTTVTQRVPRGSTFAPYAQTGSPSEIYATQHPASWDSTAQRISELVRHYQANNPIYGAAQPVESELAQELRTLVEQQFDQRHQSQVARLARLMADLEKTQQILNERQERKQEIVERRVAQLLGQRDPLNWEYEPTTPVYPVAPALGYLGPNQPPATNLNPYNSYPNTPTNGAVRTYPSNENLRARDALARESLPSDQPQLKPNSVGAPSDSMAPFALPAEPQDPLSANFMVEPGEFPPLQANPVGPAKSTPNEFPQAQAASRTEIASQQPNDLISSGFRLRSLQQSTPVLESQSRQGLISQTEIQKNKNELLEAQTIWEFKKKGLQSQIRAAELKLMGLERDASEYQKIFEAGGMNDAELRKLKQQLELHTLEFEGLIEQSRWAEKFERDELSNSSADMAAEPARDSSNQSSKDEDAVSPLEPNEDSSTEAASDDEPKAAAASDRY